MKIAADEGPLERRIGPLIIPLEKQEDAVQDRPEGRSVKQYYNNDAFGNLAAVVAGPGGEPGAAEPALRVPRYHCARGHAAG